MKHLKIFELFDQIDSYDFKLYAKSKRFETLRSKNKFDKIIYNLSGYIYLYKYYTYKFTGKYSDYYCTISYNSTLKGISLYFSNKYIDPITETTKNDFNSLFPLMNNDDYIKVMNTIIKITKNFVSQHKVVTIFIACEDNRLNMYKYILNKFYNNIETIPFKEYYKNDDNVNDDLFKDKSIIKIIL